MHPDDLFWMISLWFSLQSRIPQCATVCCQRDLQRYCRRQRTLRWGFGQSALPVHTFSHSACRHHSDYEWGMVGLALLAESSKKVPQTSHNVSLITVLVFSVTKRLLRRWSQRVGHGPRSAALRKLCSSFIWLLTKSCVGLQLSKLMSPPQRHLSVNQCDMVKMVEIICSLRFITWNSHFLLPTWVFSVQANHCMHRPKLCDFPFSLPHSLREINSLIPYIVWT